MSVTVTIDLPATLEERIRACRGDLDATAKEALLVALYRRGDLSHRALSDALGLDRQGTEALLKRHNVIEDLGKPEDYLREAAALADVVRAAPR